MLKKIKTIALQLSVLGLLLAPAFAVVGPNTVAAQADIQGGLCQGADLKFGGNENCNRGGDPQDKVNELITNVVNIFSIVVGVVAVIMIIIGGFRYIVSGGDSGNVTGAKNTILYALIGLIIVALAQFIVKFVLREAGGLSS